MFSILVKHTGRMFLFLLLLCCGLQPIIYVFGKRESLQRFVVEDGAKPAIFGSYSYDPVKQVFVPPPLENATQPGDKTFTTVSTIPDQIVNGSFVYSTAVGDVTTEKEHTKHHTDHSTTHHPDHSTTHHPDHGSSHHPDHETTHHTDHSSNHHTDHGSNHDDTDNHTTPVLRKPQKNSGWWGRPKMSIKSSNVQKFNNIF